MKTVTYEVQIYDGPEWMTWGWAKTRADADKMKMCAQNTHEYVRVVAHVSELPIPAATHPTDDIQHVAVAQLNAKGGVS